MRYLDRTHIGSLQTERHRPTFSTEQILQIYEASGRSTDLEVLQAQARVLFPEILEDGAPPLWKANGAGRAFRRPDGTFERAVCRFGSNCCRDLGILADGTPEIY